MVERATFANQQILEKVSKELAHLSLREIQRRKELLSTPLIPFKPRVGMKAWEFFEGNWVTSNMISGQSRQLMQELKATPSLSALEFFQIQPKEAGPFGKFWQAAASWDEILSCERTVFLAAAGAFVPLGGREAVVALIENSCFDILVTTSAQLTHDEVEILGGKHFNLREEISDQLDSELKKLRINRFHQVLGDVADYYLSDQVILNLISNLPSREMTSREYIHNYGKALSAEKVLDGILTAAAEKNLPIYCPALGDASFGTNILEVWYKTGKKITIDTVIADEMEKMEIVAATEDFGGRTSAVIFAGGVPRNNIQQAQACQYAVGRRGLGHAEAIRFSLTEASEGGLSGSTVSEGVTWDKYDSHIRACEVKTDSNFALNVMAQLMLELRVGKTRQFRPRFFHNPNGSLTFVTPTGKRVNLHNRFRQKIGRQVAAPSISPQR